MTMQQSRKGGNADNRASWEQTEFPIICETCLGENPYVRMTKRDFGSCFGGALVGRCGIRRLKYVKPVPNSKMSVKHVYWTSSLPTQVRDKYLNMDEKIPTSAVNKDYYLQNKEALLNNTDVAQVCSSFPGTTSLVTSDGGQTTGRAMLEKLARRTPYYKRNAPHICSFWVKGECKRGDLCPFRHEMPGDPDDPLSKQNMKDRYYGKDDPVAEKMMKRAKKDYGITEQDLRFDVLILFCSRRHKDVFYQHGEIQRINFAANKKAAFVEYT
eukprot:gene2915-5728_t